MPTHGRESLDVPPHPLWRFLADSASARPRATALGVPGGASVAFADLGRLAMRWRAAFRAGGARSGDRALLLLPNDPGYVAAYHGAVAEGLVVTAASLHLHDAEIAPYAQDSGARFVVAEADCAARAARIAPDAAVLLADADGGPSGVSDTRDGPALAGPDDLAVLQYTSGTTGGVKAAMLTHRNLVANALQNNAWFSWTDRDVVLGALPLCHVWGMCCVMNASLAAGAHVVFPRDAGPAAVLDAIESHRITVAYGSATMFHRLLDEAGASAPRRLASLRYVKAGAMLVGGDLYQRWRAAVPSVPMINGYGLSEASPEVTNNPPGAPRAGTVGLPIAGTSIRLCDPEAPETEVASGAEGEVQVRGPQVMRGYWNRPDATRDAFTADGWLRTGDLGAFDEAGYLVIRDRLKDLIKHKGWSVVPGDVERALREHPDVSEACVVGVPDPRDGEVPVAFVVLRDGASAPGWDAHLAPRLVRWKHPTRFEVVAAIPKNHVGKPLRRVLRDQASAQRRSDAST